MGKVFIALVLCTALGIIVISNFLSIDELRRCEVSPTNVGNCQKADAIVAISGGNTSARTEEAIDLYKAGWADKLIFSGAAQDTSGPSNAQVMRQQAIDENIEPEHILIDELSQTTKQNAELTKRLFEQHSIDRVILVTSGYHQRRAGLEFQAMAGESVTIINHPTAHDTDWSAWWWLTPRGWWLTGGEVVKIIAFHMGESQ